MPTDDNMNQYVKGNLFAAKCTEENCHLTAFTGHIGFISKRSMMTKYHHSDSSKSMSELHKSV